MVDGDGGDHRHEPHPRHLRTDRREHGPALERVAVVDADTGYGNPLNTVRTVELWNQAGASGIFLEDQVWPKRCGHMAPCTLASRTPVHACGALAGSQRFAPSVEAPYGTPLNTLIGPSSYP